ncbi:helical bundle domain-containing protein [Fluoribacter gormanii]|uniref:helical bundle domain-containing protein n=1 Tax=Fluoribacter gormanii TaxID=464 RepID=UPI0010410BBE|nr:helical bundle domain-containing protein [Fluoribacter gormanii]
MLSSSSQYIKALREGKYLLFLEWTDFITQKYKLLDADDTVNFLIFEWLNNGYSEEDALKLAVLQAVYDLESKPLQGKLDYSLKSITIALFICMVFQKLEGDVTELSNQDTARDAVHQFIEKNLVKLNPFTYQERLEGMQTRFYQWVEDIDKKELTDAFQKIHAITQPRYLLEDYILHLERIKIKDDELYATRLSLAKRFLGYLYEQTELTSQVAEVIATYVNSLRELHPGKGEIEQLDKISPPSTLEHTWRKVTTIGISFFNIVLGEKSIGELISGETIIFNSIDSPDSNLKM